MGVGRGRPRGDRAQRSGAQGADAGGHAVHGGREGRRLRARRGARSRARRSRVGRTASASRRSTRRSRFETRASPRRSSCSPSPRRDRDGSSLAALDRPHGDHARVRRRARQGGRLPRDTRRPYHLKVDTGMNRIGVRAEDAARVRALAQGLSRSARSRARSRTSPPPTCRATGTSSGSSSGSRRARRHADRGRRIPASCTRRTARRRSCIRRRTSTWCAAASRSTACTRRRPPYGRVELEPAMSVKARASLVKRIGMGEGVSYGLTWQASAPTDDRDAARSATRTASTASCIATRCRVLLGGERCRAGRSRVHGPAHGRGAARRAFRAR